MSNHKQQDLWFPSATTDLSTHVSLINPPATPGELVRKCRQLFRKDNHECNRMAYLSHTATNNYIIDFPNLLKLGPEDVNK